MALSNERLAEMLAGLLNHGRAKLATIYTADFVAALTELQSLRAQGGARVKELEEALSTVLDHVSETLGCGRHCVIEAEAKDEDEYAAAISRARTALKGV